MARQPRDAERLAWAVGFAQADVSAWREGDWLNALDDAKGLALLEALYLYPADAERRPDVEQVKEWLLALQKRLQRLLGQVERARTGVLERISFTGSATFTAEPPFRTLRVAYIPSSRNHRERFVLGVVQRVLDLLARTDLTRLHRCPVCKRLFLAVGRAHQTYDTATCSARARWKRFAGKKSKRRK